MVQHEEQVGFRIFPAKGGYGFIVVGKKGLKRSGLPRKKKSDIRALIKSEFPHAVEDSELAPALVESLTRFFRGDKVTLRAKLDMDDLTSFSCAVYGALRKVRRGKTVTYKELAALAGSPGAARGVGVAMRKNPFAPFVPCHRVLGASGALTGFSAEGGVELKRRMLQLEGLDVPVSK